MDDIEDQVEEAWMKASTPEARKAHDEVVPLAIPRTEAIATEALARPDLSKVPADQRPLGVGRRWLKQVRIILVLPGKRITKIFKARAHSAWTEKGVAQLLDTAADNLAKDFPGVDFRLVEVVPHQHFNIIHPLAEKRADTKSGRARQVEDVRSEDGIVDGDSQAKAMEPPDATR